MADVAALFERFRAAAFQVGPYALGFATGTSRSDQSYWECAKFAKLLVRMVAMLRATVIMESHE